MNNEEIKIIMEKKDKIMNDEIEKWKRIAEIIAKKHADFGWSIKEPILLQEIVDAGNGYANFIKQEGEKIAKLIDAGKNLKEIHKLISDDHTGFTYGMALNIGINSSKNKKNSMKVRVEHNKQYDVKNPKKGVVNPAILTLEVKENDDSIKSNRKELLDKIQKKFERS